MWTGCHGPPNSNLFLKIPDIDSTSLISSGQDLPQKCYTIFGPNTPVVLTNKTITSESNDVAANKLRFGSTIVPLGGVGPSLNQVLTFDGTNAIWGAGGGGGSGPSAFSTQIVYVRGGGDDMTGDGTILKPYASITHAMSTINDALWEKRYMIDLGPGNWADSFSWRAWVFIRGSYVFATRLTGTIDINDPSWAVPGTHFDQRAGAQDINFSGTVTLNYAAVSSLYGKFYFINCNMNNVLNITGFNPINQCVVEGGIWFGGVTATGVNILWNGVSGQGGTIALNSSTTACSFTGFGGGLIGSMALTYTVGVAPVATLIDCPVLSSVIVTGAGATLQATNSSLPPRGSINVSGGGVLTRLTDAYSLAYTPNVPGNWIGAPDNVADALDQTAARLPKSGVAVLGPGAIFVFSDINQPVGTRVTLTVQPGPAPLGTIWCSNITPGDSIATGGFTIESTNMADAGVNVYYQTWV